VVVQTDSTGSDDYVWLTTLCQNLKLNLGESPFYADRGIPAQRAVIEQVFPDYYVNLNQQYFASYFASLSIAKQASSTPTYNINAVLNNGTKLQTTVAV
jgi:hypothetical protein